MEFILIFDGGSELADVNAWVACDTHVGYVKRMVDLCT